MKTIINRKKSDETEIEKTEKDKVQDTKRMEEKGTKVRSITA